MKRYLTLLAVLGAIGGVLYLVGLVLPRTHSATSRTTFVAPPERVFDILADLGSWDEWHPDIASMEQLPEKNGHPMWLVIEKEGKRWELEVVESERPMRLYAYLHRGPDRETFRCELRWFGEGCVLRVTDQGETRAPLRRVQRLTRNAHTPLAQFLLAVGRRLGEQANPEKG